jgi:GT2 family glycosyltransferase
MRVVGELKAAVRQPVYSLVMGVRRAVLDRPRLRAALRFLGLPLIRLMLWLNRTPPKPLAPGEREPVLRLPLDYEPTARPLSAAVLLHVDHVEALPQAAMLLRRLPFPADIVATTDGEAGREAVLAAFKGFSLGSVEARITPAVGRNVAPPLVACRDVLDSHEVVLVLHTKVFPSFDPRAGWRNFALRDLLGSRQLARGAMEAFATLPQLGVLAPRTFPLARRDMVWGDSYVPARRLAERMGAALFPDSPLDFAAGFMFWARSAALKPLLDLELGWDDFTPETDGLADAVERLLFYACELAGFRWLRAGADTEIVQPEGVYAVWGPRQLTGALSMYGRTVLLPGRPPRPLNGTAPATVTKNADPKAASRAADPKAAFRAACRAELDAFLDGGERLRMPTSQTPVVSILLVLFNQAELTFECLRALRLALDVPCEVILVDNASSDRTGELLDRIDGAKIVRNAENLHFLRGVNGGAELARGRHMLLLNNDTRLAAGSIAAAVERLDAEPDLGAVGGRIVLLDGTLQEAGSIIWRDGSCLGYGRGDDPWAPEHQFRRDVDYCSGAFLMVPRALFEKLGRFDLRFAPAYYEETDLCMRIREAGFRVGYDPRICMSHFEFASSESSQSALDLQAAHQKVFVERHDATLKRSHSPSGSRPLLARMRGEHRGRVLIIDDQIPYPHLGAGYPRALDIVRAAHQAGWFVTFYPSSFPDADFAQAYRVLPPDLEVAAERGRHGLVKFMREREGYYDAVLISRPHNMETFRAALAQVPRFIALSKVVYDAEAIFALRDQTRAQLPGMRPSAAQSSSVEEELALSVGVGVVLAVNEAEAKAFRRAEVGQVRVLGHGLAARPTSGAFEDRRDFLFVGALDEDESPNVDSLEFFVREVAPRLDALIGADWTLRVAGRSGAPKVQALRSDRVQLLGRVEDLTPLYAGSRVFIAPTRYAAGIPMKVHEAAAHGLPCAVTSLLAGQLGWADGVAVTVGDTAEAFARACQRLYEDAAAWEAVRAGALARIQAECSPKAFAATVEGALAAAANDVVGRDPRIASSARRKELSAS